MTSEINSTEQTSQKQVLDYDSKPWLSCYPPGVPATIEYPKQSVFDFLTSAVDEFPDSTALIFFDRKTSYKEFYDKVGRFATALHNLGVKKGDRVGIFLPNIPQYAIAFFAIQRLGGVSVAFNTQYQEHEIVHQINDSEIEVMICLDYVLYQRLKKVKDRINLKHIIVTSVGSEISLSKRILGTLTGKLPLPRSIDNQDLSMEKMIEETSNSPPKVRIDPHEDLALVQYTGGTTGLSKGAMITHFNIVSNVIALNEWIKPPMKKGEQRFVGVLPLFHCYGLITCLVSAISLASSLILVPDAAAGRPRFQDLLETIIKHRPTIFHGVPTLYLGLLFHPKIKDYDLTSIRACVSGSAPLPIEVMKNFEELTGANVVEGYGLTECTPVTHVNPISPDGVKKGGTIGLPFPDTEAKIFDPADPEKELPVGEEGELGIRGPQVMKGYWKRPEETAAIMNSQGFLLTGDIAKMDNEGYFEITDRKKDMINVSGFKAFPREIEELLYEHPAVQEAAVVGVPHEYTGETVKAFIVVKDGETVSEDELKEFCRYRLAKYKVPRYIEFIDELPKSAIGKVLRRVLREEENNKL